MQKFQLEIGYCERCNVLQNVKKTKTGSKNLVPFFYTILIQMQKCLSLKTCSQNSDCRSD